VYNVVSSILLGIKFAGYPKLLHNKHKVGKH
jgi:hypothetical protein